MSRVFEALQRSGSDRIAQAVVGDITVVPSVSDSRITEEKIVNTKQELEEVVSLQLTPRPENRLVALTDPTSLGAEKLRLLALRLAHIRQQRGLRTLVVTSTGPEEGKSLISANLAIALARQPREKVLLVEGDIRKPALVGIFNASLPLGLTDYLRQGKKGIFEFLRRFDDLPLWLLPAGSLSEDPLETLQSTRVPQLIGEVADWFTWIIIDSPPIIPLADTSVWTRLADGILFVIREGKTSKEQLEQAVTSLDRAKVVGAVFNDTRSAEHNHYKYYRYGYGKRDKRVQELKRQSPKTLNAGTAEASRCKSDNSL